MCNIIRRLQHHQAPRPLVRLRLCRCAALDALPQSSLPLVHLLRAFQPLLGPSATASHDLDNVVHLWYLDTLLRILNLVLAAGVGDVDQIVFLRSCDVSEVRIVLTSHVLHDGMRDLVIDVLDCGRRCSVGLFLSSAHRRVGTGLFPTRSGSALFTRSGSALFSSSSLWCLSKLLGTPRRSHLSVAPCTTFSWRPTICFFANCSLVYSMLTHVLRVVCWTDQHGVRQRPRHRPALANFLCMDVVVVVLCSGLWGALSPKLSRLDHRVELCSCALALSAAAAALATCLKVSGHFSTQTRLN